MARIKKVLKKKESSISNDTVSKIDVVALKENVVPSKNDIDENKMQVAIDENKMQIVKSTDNDNVAGELLYND